MRAHKGSKYNDGSPQQSYLANFNKFVRLLRLDNILTLRQYGVMLILGQLQLSESDLLCHVV